MSNKINDDKIKSCFIGDGYQPSDIGNKPNGRPQTGHTPERSEAKPVNPPKKRWLYYWVSVGCAQRT